MTVIAQQPADSSEHSSVDAIVFSDGGPTAAARAAELCGRLGLPIAGTVVATDTGLSVEVGPGSRHFAADDELLGCSELIPAGTHLVVISGPNTLPAVHLALSEVLAGHPLTVVIDDWWPALLHELDPEVEHFWSGMLERLARRADHVVTSSGAQRVSLAHRLGVDVLVVSPSTRRTPAVLPIRNSAPVTFGYIGSVAGAVGQSLGVLALAMSSVDDVVLDIHSPMAGREWFWLRGLRELQGVRLQELPELQPARHAANADADVVVWATGFDVATIEAHRHAVPQGFVDALASGRPLLVIAPEDLAVSALARDHGAVVVSSPELEEIIAATEDLRDPNRRAQVAQAGAALSHRFLSDDVIATGAEWDALASHEPLPAVSLPSEVPATTQTTEQGVDTPIITLIMPLLNAQPYLGHALASFAEQGDARFEVIAVDGGSTDGTRELIGENGYVRVIDAPGLSQTEALNLGFAEARGSIFGWLNGDDLLAPGALGWVIDWFDRHPDAALVYGDSLAINERGRSYGVRANVKAGQYDQLVHGDFIVQPSAFWRREIHERHGPLDDTLDYIFDYAFFLDVAREHELHYEPVVLSLERLRGGAKTASGGTERADEFVRLMERHTGPEVPAAFRPEVGAVHAANGFRRLRRGEVRAAVALFREANREGRPRGLTAAHLVASLVAGGRGTAEARLISNWLRVRTGRSRRSPVWPT